MSDWDCTQLTFSDGENHFHSHSYYDIPIFDGSGRFVIGYQTAFSDRQPTVEDAVEVGLVDTDTPGSWQRIGTSTAWSWQQGPMAQWIAGGPRVIWNDNENGRHVARIRDTTTGAVETLAMPVYCVDGAGRYAFSVNMARLNTLRPGYGYPGGADGQLDETRPQSDGIWRFDLTHASSELILSLSRAVTFMRRMIGWREWGKHLVSPYVYWFNHIKLSPDGKRFTVKLRWRRIGGKRRDRMGVSLTCNVDGSDLRLLATATSHVIWQDKGRLYCWKEGAIREYEDNAPRGIEKGLIAPDLIQANAHIRHLDREARYFVFDTPYRETIDLNILDRVEGDYEHLARFSGHTPKSGEFRCDLHPCPNGHGDRIVVTSMHDDGRQIYVLAKRN